MDDVSLLFENAWETQILHLDGRSDERVLYTNKETKTSVATLNEARISTPTEGFYVF